jgi:RNA polymerase sigma factor (sigma-70 family)
METEYKDIVEYIEDAKKTIRLFANKICPGICYEMTQSEDAIADVAHAMMCADWKYDENKRGKISNKSKTRYSYRNQCAIWAIQTYIKKSLRKNNRTVYLNHMLANMDDVQFEDILEDKKQKQAEHIYIEKEENEHNSRLIENILNSDLLSPVQQEKMKMHYIDGKSLATIGRKYGVTREAIRQTIQGCIKKLQGEFA